MTRATRRICCVSILLCAGCGSGVQDAVLLAGESGARTFIDILISDIFADLPDLVTFPPGVDTSADAVAETDVATDGGTGTDGAADTPTDSGGVGAGLTGVASNGEALFSANGCSGCHCPAADACTSGRINLHGVQAARIEEKTQSDLFHTGGKFPDLTEQDLVDLEAFFAS